jgi:hypothetical protein
MHGITHGLKALALAGCVLAVPLLFSCRAGTAPRWRYDDEGKPHEYKRYARNMSVDQFNRYFRRCYYKVKHPLEHFISDDQRDYITAHGQPDYTRKPFRSREDERVEEWLYLAKNRLVQWVKGGQVFEGDVTDMERIMIRLGYPTGILVSQEEPSVERFTFTYDKPLDRQHEVYSFANGQLVFSQTQR